MLKKITGVARSKAPLPRDIRGALDKIKETDFWLCVQFADTLIRYLEITMKQDRVVSRLQGSALYFLLLDGGESTPTQLARDMLRSKHSVTKIIDGLEKEGLIVRSSTNKDRRVTSVKLTARGLERVKQRFSRGNERAGQVMASLNVKEQKRLVALTGKMCQRINAILDSL
jgi:DNA-binding MarR family transcriptional regulator